MKQCLGDTGAPFAETILSVNPQIHPSWSLQQETTTLSWTLYSHVKVYLWVWSRALNLGSFPVSLQFPILQLPSWNPFWLSSVMLGLGIFTRVCFQTGVLALNQGNKAFSIHPPPSQTGFRKSPGNIVGRTSYEPERRVSQLKLPNKLGFLASP